MVSQTLQVLVPDLLGTEQLRLAFQQYQVGAAPHREESPAEVPGGVRRHSDRGQLPPLQDLQVLYLIQQHHLRKSAASQGAGSLLPEPRAGVPLQPRRALRARGQRVQLQPVPRGRPLLQAVHGPPAGAPRPGPGAEVPILRPPPAGDRGEARRVLRLPRRRQQPRPPRPAQRGHTRHDRAH